MHCNVLGCSALNCSIGDFETTGQARAAGYQHRLQLRLVQVGRHNSTALLTELRCSSHEEILDVDASGEFDLSWQIPNDNGVPIGKKKSTIQ